MVFAYFMLACKLFSYNHLAKIVFSLFVFITTILNRFPISKIYFDNPKRTESIKAPDDYTAIIIVIVSGMGLFPEIQSCSVHVPLWVYLSLCPVCSMRLFVIVDVQKMHYAYVVRLWWLWKGLRHSENLAF